MDHHVLWGTNACHWVRSTSNEDAVRPSSDIPERSRTAQVYPRRCGWYALGLPAVGRLVRRCGTASPRPSEHLATSRCADRSHLPWSRSPRDRPPTTETAKTPEQWTGCSGWADIGRRHASRSSPTGQALGRVSLLQAAAEPRSGRAQLCRRRRPALHCRAARCDGGSGRDCLGSIPAGCDRCNRGQP
jgi:hypothetical protein